MTRQHDLKRAVAERTGVAHESPQVIVVRDGRVAWSAAHFAITAGAVAQAVRELDATTAPSAGTRVTERPPRGSDTPEGL